MSKKNIYLLVIGIITIFCIIAGSIIHLKNTNLFEGDFDEESNFSNYTVLEDFESISITGKVLEIKIIEGDVPGIKILSNKEKLLPEVNQNSSKLIINQDNTGKVYGNSNCKVFITVPDYLSLKDIEIEVNVGTIDISHIYSDSIDVSTNVGELNFDNIEFQKLEGESNVGEISLKLPNISDSLDCFNINLSTNVGEVNVNGDKFKKNYNKKGDTSKSIELCTNVGEIVIK